jgi:NADH-quinone oxidoreductase subunit B
VSATIRARTYRVAAQPDVVVSLANLGLACCSLEVDAAVQSGLLVEARADPSCTVLLVSGTVTEPLAPAVAQAVAAFDGDVRVVSVGACATSGGPYWDAPMVISGVDRLVPVSTYVAGCPPRPEALVTAIAEVARG